MIDAVLRALSINLGLSSSEIARLIETAPERYKVYQIPKRHGGTRTIAQPSSELKVIQRLVMKEVLSRCPVHDIAMAYARGRSIHDNAYVHRSGKAILKLDFKAFFPSITARDWTIYAENDPLSLDQRSIYYFAKILFWGQRTSIPICLSIGAPSSPMLSNILMHGLDQQFAEISHKSGCKITRYADDITISSDDPEACLRVEREIRKVIRYTRSPALSLNEEKRGLYLSGQRLLVTGLVVTPQEKISIGRERKREISVMIHHFKTGQLDKDSVNKLKGYLAFAKDVEPSFVASMKKKYGGNLIEVIVRSGG